MEKASDLGDGGLRPIPQVIPTEPWNSIAGGFKHLVAMTIARLRQRVVVKLASIGFDRETLRAPKEVDLERLASEDQSLIALGDRDIALGKQGQQLCLHAAA